MQQLSRRGFLARMSSVGACAVNPYTCLADAVTPTDEWTVIANTARSFVLDETDETSWPFKAAEPEALKASRRKVWIHYFTPLPLSLDNLPNGQDYYQDNAMRRDGEGGKYSAQGGYLRDRPLSPGHLATSQWRLVDGAIDLMRADRIGADGFMLDIDWLKPDGQLHEIMEALCTAADRISPHLRIIAQPDMASLSVQDPMEIGAYLRKLTSEHRSLYRLRDGRLVVAPFAPDNRPAEFWASFTNDMQCAGQPIALLPVMLNFGKVSPFLPLAYGLSAWGVREPQDAAQMAKQLSERARNLETWVMPIAAQDSRPNSSIFWEASNTRLFRSLWTAAMTYRAPEVHLITWNDFSESTEIEPSFATQYVFYDLAAFFIATFKLGRPPKIVRDAIYYTHRRQIVRDAQTAVAGDRPMRRLGSAMLSNDIEMLAFLTAPAILEVTIGDNVIRAAAPAGLSELRAPAAPGQPHFRIIRNQKTIVELASGWSIIEQPDRDDFTYYGGSSTRKQILYLDTR